MRGSPSVAFSVPGGPTASVAALVSVSSFLASSVKLTLTLMATPLSEAARV